MGIVEKHAKKNFLSGTIQLRNLSTGLAADGASPETFEAQKSQRNGTGSRKGAERTFPSLIGLDRFGD
jgi:hypothetical protein